MDWFLGEGVQGVVEVIPGIPASQTKANFERWGKFELNGGVSKVWEQEGAMVGG